MLTETSNLSRPTKKLCVLVGTMWLQLCASSSLVFLWMLLPLPLCHSKYEAGTNPVGCVQDIATAMNLKETFDPMTPRLCLELCKLSLIRYSAADLGSDKCYCKGSNPTTSAVPTAAAAAAAAPFQNCAIGLHDVSWEVSLALYWTALHSTAGMDGWMDGWMDG